MSWRIHRAASSPAAIVSTVAVITRLFTDQTVIPGTWHQSSMLVNPITTWMTQTCHVTVGLPTGWISCHKHAYEGEASRGEASGGKADPGSTSVPPRCLQTPPKLNLTSYKECVLLHMQPMKVVNQCASVACDRVACTV